MIKRSDCYMGGSRVERVIDQLLQNQPPREVQFPRSARRNSTGDFVRWVHLRRTPECQRADCARKRSGVAGSGVATVSTRPCSEAGGSDQGGASVGVAASVRGGVIHSEAACLSTGCPTLVPRHRDFDDLLGGASS